ncbi:unnamed protein product [Coffea canephora]|uniref:Knottins-like domain-containing protein n=1 Tax=Coffea canephora TaxID=49390 RepID=A0A068TUE0_COFCA|nr:unnamed protein product [Coffea canephora]
MIFQRDQKKLKRLESTMEMRKCFGTMLLLSLLFISYDIVMEAEAAVCSKPSTYFFGPCVRRSTCRRACSHENYPDGKCSRFLGKCICYKPCTT